MFKSPGVVYIPELPHLGSITGGEKVERIPNFGHGFIKPDYGRWCFAGLPEAIQTLLGCKISPSFSITEAIQGGNSIAKRLVLILVDAFGWRFLNQFQELQSISETLKGCDIACLTSQFPTTTAAHLSTLHSGVPVTESGIYEWFYYEPIAGRVISPLTFNAARSGHDGRGQLLSLGLTPEQISPWESLYQKLQRHSVTSFVYHSASFATERAALHGTRGATVRPIDCIEHGFSLLKKDLSALSASTAKSYHFLYLPEFDGLAHQYGPKSGKIRECAERIFAQIAQFKNNLPEDSLLLITADHGQTEVDPQTTIYLDELAPELSNYICKGSSGEPLVPAGSARDMFLHLVPEAQTTMRTMLADKLRDHAAVYSRDELKELGIFGSNPSARFTERLGDTVILPFEGQSVWWSENNKFDMPFLGHHGGLLADEILIPLISYRN